MSAVVAQDIEQGVQEPAALGLLLLDRLLINGLRRRLRRGLFYYEFLAAVHTKFGSVGQLCSAIWTYYHFGHSFLTHDQTSDDLI